MQDLNDLQLFALVVRHGGFAAAERASGEAKSKLSKRVARLEARYGARLIERSTRSFRVTDIGRDVYRQCEAIIERLEATDAIVARARDEVSGCLRISSPPGLMQYYNSHLLLGFMARYPDVRVQLLIHERHVDLINEKIDVAFRITSHFDQDQSLIKRDLGVRQRILVAGAQLVEKAGGLPQSFEQLASLPTLSMGEWLDRDRWEFEDNAGNQRTFVHVPRLCCGDYSTLHSAAIAGMGVAFLPIHLCANELRTGQLLRLLPQWRAPSSIVHLVFTSGKGLLPPVRAFIDHSVEVFAEANRRLSMMPVA